jgi:hypothetical protein
MISNWKSAWRWFSVQAMALQGAAASAWLMVPDDMRAAVPPDMLATGAVVLAVLGIMGRLVDQGSRE